MTEAPKYSAVDLSHYDHVHSFSEIQKAGMTMVLQKCTQGTRYLDPTYHSRRQMVRRTDMAFAAYHFFDGSNPVAQAAWFKSHASVCDDYAVDFEEQIPLSNLITFITTFEKIAHRPLIVYGNRKFLGNLVEASTPSMKSFLSARRLWWAEYGVETPKLPTPWSTYWLWQATQTGSLAGVSNHCDLNVSGPA